MKAVVLVLFIGAYASMLVCPDWRSLTASVIAAALILIGAVSPSDAFTAVDFNVILMLMGTMGTVSLFIKSKMPAKIADMLVNKIGDVKLIFVALAVFAGLVSAFIDNVATVLMLSPIALEIARKFKVNPVSAVLAVAVSSNLQGAATLVGDTTSILLGGYAGMDFADFFIMDGHPGMFFIVQAGALATIPVLFSIFKRYNYKIKPSAVTKVTDFLPTFLLLGTVAGLIAASFTENKPKLTNGIICIAFFAVGIIAELIKDKSLSGIPANLAEIDFKTLILLCGLFIIISAVENVGLIDDISRLFIILGGDNIFIIYTLVVWFSVFFSAFIDNIPYVATMLPVVSGIAVSLGCEPTVLYFGLLAGATLGGNLTPVGASANIAATGILKKEGYTVSTKEFMSIGVPFTLAAVLFGYILIWVIYGI